MKAFKMMFTGLMVFLLVSSAALAGDFDWLQNLNIRAEADPSGFRAQLDTRFFHDGLFAAPSERIIAGDVFALSPEMRRYVSDEIAARSRTKGRQRGLIDALSSRRQAASRTQSIEAGPFRIRP